ncbi:MAG: hypothetical protein WCR52_14075 [Bacteroidota bacterium]
MEELIEITFEEVKLESLTHLLVAFASGSTLLNYDVASDPFDETLVDLKDESKLLTALSLLTNYAIYFNFPEFEFAGLALSAVGIQVFGYNGKLDLNIIFDYNLTTNKVSIPSLQAWASLIAVQSNAKTYFCGLEPAVNLNTRFFTEDILGPLG